MHEDLNHLKPTQVDFLGGDIEELRHDPGSMAALSYAEMLKQCMKYAFVLNQQPTDAKHK